jgi:O-antigen/teichoic acid export membrane protein
MNLKNKIIKGLLWSVVESWGRQIISLLVFFLLARLLGPESYGLVALVSIYLAFVENFVDQGLTQAIIQKEELESAHLDSAFWISSLMGLLLALISLLGADLIALFFNEPRISPIIRCLSVTLVLSGVSNVQNAILQRNFAFKELAKLSLLIYSLGGCVGVGMALTGFGVWSLVGQQLFNAIMRPIILWSVGEWKPQVQFSKKHFLELFSFSLNIFFTNILGFVNTRADDLLIGYFLGPVALGYYSIAYKIIFIILDVLSGITGKVSMSVFSRLQGQPKKIETAFYRSTKLIILISAPIFLGISVLGTDLVNIIFGPQWMPSSPIIKILAIYGFIHAAFSFNVVVILASGKSGLQLAAAAVHTVANIIAFYISVRFGIIAVAVAFVVQSYFIAPFDLWLVNKVMPINLHLYCKSYASPIFSSAFMAASILVSKNYLSDITSIYISVLISSIIGCVTYISMIRITDPKLFWEIFQLTSSTKAANLDL